MKIGFLSSAMLAATLSIGVAPTSRAHSSVALEPEHKVLRSITDDYWQWYQSQNPESATAYGEYQYNDRLRDLSLAQIQAGAAEAELLLKRLQAIDGGRLNEADRLDQQILISTLTDKLEEFRLEKYLMPLDQMNGVHLQLANLVTLAPFDSVAHYDDYIARLNQTPRLFGQLIILLRRGADAGLTPPRYLLEKVVEQLKELQQPAPKRSVFAGPLAHMPKHFSAAAKQRLRRELLSAVANKVRPAYRRLQLFIAHEYAPKGRTEFGLWSVPDGDARYRFAVRTQTTSSYTPEQIHQLGLKQVAELEAQIDALARRSGYADGKSFSKKMHASASNIPTSRQQILDDYRRHIAAMESKMPALFGLQPKAKVLISSVPAYMEKDGSTQYLQATPDGKRAGQIWVNTYDHAHKSMSDNEATAYHEGIPGHHLQMSIAQELPDTHPFHRSLSDQYNAYLEGWALYSERLGKEVGFYQDPASDLGRLESELFRAMRLVLDTGVHYKRWSRQQMVDYFVAHLDDPLESEVDRYIADPGQALGYTIGQLKILELRQRAQTALGEKFDIRSFHDAILGAGALPLDLLEARIDGWIGRQKLK